MSTAWLEVVASKSPLLCQMLPLQVQDDGEYPGAQRRSLGNQEAVAPRSLEQLLFTNQ